MFDYKVRLLRKTHLFTTANTWPVVIPTRTDASENCRIVKHVHRRLGIVVNKQHN